MEDSLATSLEHLTGAGIAAGIVIFIAVVGIVYRIGRLSERFEHHEKHFEKFNNATERIVEIDTRTAHNEKQINKYATLPHTLIKLETKMDMVLSFVNPNSPIKAQSPISLTHIGTAIANNLDANKILSRYKDKAKSEVDIESPQNAYDIQMAAMKVAKEKLLSFLADDELEAVKKEAFARGLSLEDIMSVFGVLLRDCILEEKGIPITDVDHHAPK